MTCDCTELGLASGNNCTAALASITGSAYCSAYVMHMLTAAQATTHVPINTQKPSPAQAQLHSSRHHKITTTCACNHTEILCAHSATKGGPSTTLLHSLCTVQGRSEEANTQPEQTPRKGSLLLPAILQQRQKAAALTLPGAMLFPAMHLWSPCTHSTAARHAQQHVCNQRLQRSKLATNTPHGD